MSYSLADDIFSGNTRSDSTRAGFGRGLVQAGENNVNVVALTADLAESVQFHHFAERFPERFIEVGIAEQNLVTVASGMAHVGKIPFTGSYAAFSPGRNWEQIRTTIALNNQPVKIVGSHAGLNVGPDGATHQVLEDIALMRTLPNMIVIAPGDAVEAEKVARAVANDSRPTYIRLAREKSPIFSTDDSPFEIGPAYVLREGSDISLLSTGTMTAQVLLAADQLARQGVLAEVVHVPTIKPLDEETILKSVRKTGNAVTIEEHQIAGGFGSAIAELLGEQLPTKMKRIGVDDQFGQSGTATELLDHYGLTADKIAQTISDFLSQVDQSATI
ncbi:MAG TPA: transketolase family protein [Candidatus Nanoperiomorbaceae bacterium]|nr:transketolase family protein [Candidatus Nanoperiomorbaceae bacterium]HMQ96500.1 transketolase family protein [Candidatus Nanoperiomorbaceae bacterium]HMR85917.1 transketolase family protein [Candidatus Nanoperiomorbaceae bacterium]HMU11744.1 transketolase family protein [Candidatus Nanoperiomorbaceae bacterium]